MRIVFFSNFLNHHQLPFCKEMVKLVGDGFVFVATMPFNQSLVSKGYEDMNKKYSFVLTSYDGKENYYKALKLAKDADVMIAEPSLEVFIKERIKSKKLLFKYSERLLKKRPIWYKNLYYWFKWHVTNPQNIPLYILSASAFTAGDYAKFGLFTNKCYKWGYFPEIKRYANGINELIELKRPASILWVARLIEWKHPEVAIYVAEKLKKDGISFQLNLIGDGFLFDDLQKEVVSKKLDDCVSLLGAMSPDEVRKQMEEHEIFLFTSDRNEGWGAVLNEAMNSGCAVVASNAIGSVPFMLENKKNGYIYQDGNLDDLYIKVKELCQNQQKRRQFGVAAYRTMTSVWNAELAAKRLLELIDDLQVNGASDRFKNGPCSKAEILKEGGYGL